ncbi:MAG TPA: hypothetical protein VM368_08700, partial [Flavisolibacter sp.]|nr:hypothetical protein [Flavisolibacter sp.]
MKRIIIVLLVSVHLFNIPAFCQSGDFQLNNTNGFRRFEKVSADSSLKGGPFKNLFIGKNYRPEWLQPVTVPVLNLQTDMGGITPNKEGGGKQTRNLQVKDENGNEWALRSVQKFPEKVVAPELKGTIAEKIIKQGISASYPYAALSVGTLSRAAGVPFLPNALIYIPDDPALGTFRSTYKNSLSLMELRTIYYNGSKEEKTYNSIDVIEKIQKTNANKVDQASLLRARLLDNFIMDFDRHHDQWEWVQRDSGNGKI